MALFQQFESGTKGTTAPPMDTYSSVPQYTNLPDDCISVVLTFLSLEDLLLVNKLYALNHKMRAAWILKMQDLDSFRVSWTTFHCIEQRPASDDTFPRLTTMTFKEVTRAAAEQILTNKQVVLLEEEPKPTKPMIPISDEPSLLTVKDTLADDDSYDTVDCSEILQSVGSVLANGTQEQKAAKYGPWKVIRCLLEQIAVPSAIPRFGHLQKVVEGLPLQQLVFRAPHVPQFGCSETHMIVELQTANNQRRWFSWECQKLKGNEALYALGLA
eukprot:TRINITY_DN51552_c0_g1_i1.p1 TRINITY_DN51552_c0_g1~~TRINITY_DN51552_c0_g1_i1.p1  ORF type:complete len:271 (-),score=4.89 TRINITY_DN51552_c0_g1_i1:197-1009(-)